MSAIEEMQMKTFQFLRNLYELDIQNPFEVSNMYHIGDNLNFDRKLTEKVVWDLYQGGLVENLNVGGGLNISHEGRIAVQQALDNNRQRKTYSTSSVTNINYIHHMARSSIQQAGHNTRQDAAISEHREIHQGDLSSLRKFLLGQGVDNPDLEELETAIEQDPPPPEPNRLGTKVSAWIGKMVSKAASGAWNVTTSVALQTLTKAILSYYGFNS